MKQITMCKIVQKQYFSFILALLGSLRDNPECLVCLYHCRRKKLGKKEIYDKLEKNNFLLHDKKFEAYISKIGNHVLQRSDKALF